MDVLAFGHTHNLHNPPAYRQNENENPPQKRIDNKNVSIVIVLLNQR